VESSSTYAETKEDEGLKMWHEEESKRRLMIAVLRGEEEVSGRR
jgi:hypothetical protein